MIAYNAQIYDSKMYDVLSAFVKSAAIDAHESWYKTGEINQPWRLALSRGNRAQQQFDLLCALFPRPVVEPTEPTERAPETVLPDCEQPIFKKGDRVVCIDDAFPQGVSLYTVMNDFDFWPNLNEVYTIRGIGEFEGVGRTLVWLEGMDNQPKYFSDLGFSMEPAFDANRFKLAPQDAAGTVLPDLSKAFDEFDKLNTASPIEAKEASPPRFKKGDVIVCIDDSIPSHEVFNDFRFWVVNGTGYVVRGFQHLLDGEQSVYLQGFENKPIQLDFKIEPAYNSRRFRLATADEMAIFEILLKWEAKFEGATTSLKGEGVYYVASFDGPKQGLFVAAAPNPLEAATMLGQQLHARLHPCHAA